MLNEKLASVLLDCHVKEDPVMKDAKIAEVTITGESHLSLARIFALSQTFPFSSKYL